MRFLEDRKAVIAMGRDIGPQALGGAQDLYRSEHDELARRIDVLEKDVAYGPHPRHRLDLYRAAGPQKGPPVPIIVWVHGGGFMRGAKSFPDHPFEAHVGRFAADHGFLGVVMNYRLAPQDGWPAGAEDLGKVVDWLREHAASKGGDPDRILLVGASAGAVHVATHLKLRFDAPGVRGVVLLSGLYGFTPSDGERDAAYYGTDAEAYAARVPDTAVIRTTTPMFLCCAEFDPPRFQFEFLELMQRRLAHHGQVPRSWIGTGHNHYTMAYHLGSSDTRLADELLSFAHDCFA